MVWLELTAVKEYQTSYKLPLVHAAGTPPLMVALFNVPVVLVHVVLGVKLVAPVQLSLTGAWALVWMKKNTASTQNTANRSNTGFVFIVIRFG